MPCWGTTRNLRIVREKQVCPTTPVALQGRKQGGYQQEIVGLLDMAEQEAGLAHLSRGSVRGGKSKTVAILEEEETSMDVFWTH